MNPSQRAEALGRLEDEQADIQLIDDGAPPAFDLVFDATSGASLQGKLPNGMSASDLADALGVDNIRDRVRISNLNEGARTRRDAVAALTALAPHLALFEHLEMSLKDGALSVSVAVMTGWNADVLRTRLRRMPSAVAFELENAAPPPSGTRRVHAATGQAQVFSQGHWLPILTVALDADSCDTAANDVPLIPFAPRSFSLGFDAISPMNHLTALARACVGLGGMRIEIAATATTASAEVLNAQLGRRRADAIRRELIARGIDNDAIRARSGQAGAEETIAYRFSDDR